MEFILALYSLSGFIKLIMQYYHLSLPLDFTALMAILLIAVLLYRYLKYGFKIKINTYHIVTTAFLLLYYCWMAISLYYTPSHNYSHEKIFLFGTVMVGFAAPFLDKKFNVFIFLRILLFLIIIFSSWFLYYYHGYINRIYSQEFANIKGGYLAVGYLLGLNVILLSTDHDNQIIRRKWLRYVLGILSFLLLMTSSARGPILFTFLILLLVFVYLIIRWSRIKIKIGLKIDIRVLIPVSLVLLFGLLILLRFRTELGLLLQHTFDRMMIIVVGINSTSGDYGNSINTRFDHYHFSIYHILKTPFTLIMGNGVGSYGILYTGVDSKEYPHNILLEVIFETGLIGLLIIAVFSIPIIFKLVKEHSYISGFVLLYLLLNALKSGTLTDLRLFFTIISIFLLTVRKDDINFLTKL